MDDRGKSIRDDNHAQNSHIHTLWDSDMMDNNKMGHNNDHNNNRGKDNNPRNKGKTQDNCNRTPPLCVLDNMPSPQ